MNIKKILSVGLVPVFMLSVFAYSIPQVFAQSDTTTTYAFSYASAAAVGGFHGKGTLDVSDGVIVGLTGTQNGQPMTVDAPGAFASNDNVFSGTTPYVSENGFSFNVGTTTYNIYYFATTEGGYAPTGCAVGAICVTASATGAPSTQINFSAIALATVTSVASVNAITIGKGIPSPSLPSTVGVTLSDGSTSTYPVAWSDSSYVDTTPGTYAFTGTLTLPSNISPTTLTASANVIVTSVGPMPHLATVSSTTPISDITIGEGIPSPSLPSTVGVTLSDGSTSTYPVAWSDSSYVDTTPGTYAFTGTLTTPLGVSANGKTASVNVIVAPTSVYGIPPEEPGNANGIGSSATTTDVLEAFIQTSGVTFANPGFITDSGWTATTTSPTYAAEYGPSLSSITENLNIAVGAPTVVVDIYAFEGCTTQPTSACPSSDLVDAYQVTFTNGGNPQWATNLSTTTLANENTATPANLVLTVPTSATITQSTLVPETSGVPTNNDAVSSTVANITPIAVTLTNTGETASAVNVRIAPINAGSNVQLWAKDTSGNWYDINVTGWIAAPGIAVPAGYNVTTNVYPISNAAGSYHLTANLVNAAAPSTVVATGSGTLVVNVAPAAAFTITPSSTQAYTGTPTSFNVGISGAILPSDTGDQITLAFNVKDGTTPVVGQAFALSGIAGQDISSLGTLATSTDNNGTISVTGSLDDLTSMFGVSASDLVAELNGGTAAAATVSTTFANPGTYNLSLTASDANGTIASTTGTMIVAPATTPMTLSSSSIVAGQSFTGTISNLDPISPFNSVGISVNGGTQTVISPASGLFLLSAADNKDLGNGLSITSCPMSSSTFDGSALSSVTCDMSSAATTTPNAYNIVVSFYSSTDGSGTALGTTGTGTTLTVSAPASVTLSSLAITTPATKLAYTVGDTLDISGLVVTGTYSDGSTSTEAIVPADVTGFSSSAANPSEALTVTYGGKTATFDVSVVAPTPVLESISGVAAINGTVTITLAAVPTVAPVAGDFTATSAIGGGTASALPLTGFTYDSNVTVTYNFASIAQTASDQSVVVAVTLGGIATAAPAFTVTAIPGATSSDDAITSFILGVPGEIDTISSGAVAVTVPSGTNVASLTPTIAVSVGATVSPTTAQDFTSPVTYTVTAADTTTTQPYIVTVTVSAPQLSADATLSALTVGGTAVTGFAPATLTYSVTLPAGTTDVPTVIATANDAGATAVVTPAASLLGATNVLVTAASGATQTYTVNFTVAPAPLATDDTLSALTASAGTLSPDFVSSTITYSDVLPYGTSAAPTVTATTTDTNATDTITQATSPTGSATVAVLAQDASTTQTYTINFSVAANTVVVSSGGGGGGGGGSAQANIGITSAVDNGSPTTGSTIHYTLTVSATGPSTSFGIMANDILPAGLTFVSASSSEGSYNSSTGAWTIGSLNVGQTATLTIAATVTASTGTAITNTATVSESSAVINSNAANDSSSVTVNVGGTSTGQVLGASTTGGGNVGQVLGASTTNTVALLQELQNLEQQLITLEFKANSCSLTFNTNLSKGMTNSEVQNLQKVLNYTSLTQVASTGPGSPNNESTYFGSATKNAVIAFQNIFANQILTPNGLTSGNGYVGATTRSVLNGLCSQ